MHVLLPRILSLLYPPRCPYCGAVAAGGEEMCADCRQQHEKITVYRGIAGMIPAAGGNNEEEGNKLPCAVPFVYTGAVREAILRYKFHGHREYAAAFGISLCKAVELRFGGVKFDAVTYVPLSKQRYRQRGYDQAELLARAVGKKQNVPCKAFLCKQKDNFEQHKLSRPQRAENVAGVYVMRKNGMARGKTILLCDDITTTGATLRECAAVLLRDGACAVYCAALAVTLLA